MPSKIVFLVVSDSEMLIPAITIPSNAAESSTITVRIEGSLLSWNSLTKVLKLTFSPRDSMVCLNK